MSDTKLMMSVEPADAAALANIEVQRLLAANLEKIATRLDRQDERWTKRWDEQAAVLNRVDVRLTKIESNRLDGTVKALGAAVEANAVRIDALEADRDKRAGATGVFAWVFKTPILQWLALAAVAVWAFLERKVGQ